MVFLQDLDTRSCPIPSLDVHSTQLCLLWPFHGRNYLEYVSPSITNWTKAEEERHRAELLKLELQRVQASQQSGDAPSATPPSSTVPGKRPRSKSPKKGSKSRMKFVKICHRCSAPYFHCRNACSADNIQSIVINGGIFLEQWFLIFSNLVNR